MLGTFAGACRSRGRREAGGGDLNDGGRRQDGLDDDGDVDGVQDARSAEANRVGERWRVIMVLRVRLNLRSKLLIDRKVPQLT